MVYCQQLPLWSGGRKISSEGGRRVGPMPWMTKVIHLAVRGGLRTGQTQVKKSFPVYQPHPQLSPKSSRDVSEPEPVGDGMLHGTNLS